MQLKGVDKLIKNLNKEFKNLSGDKAQRAFIRIVILLRRDMEKTTPTTPIDLGNLRASWYTVTTRNVTGEGAIFNGETESAEMSADHAGAIARAKSLTKVYKHPVLVMGYSANYAAWVHEMVDANFSRPGSGAKWFEEALKRNQDKILKIMAEELEVEK